MIGVALLIIFLLVFLLVYLSKRSSKRSSTTDDVVVEYKPNPSTSQTTEKRKTEEIKKERVLSETEQYLSSRGVTRLVHFTRAENLLSIFSHGIVPNDKLRGIGKEDSINDKKRYDGHRDANCLSIQFPNYKMFYRLRRYSNSSWVVLCINPKVLDHYDAAFYKMNAASKAMQADQLPFDKKRGLASMFDETVNGISRSQTGIPSSYTTDPQAEVLVFGTIKPEFIDEVLFAGEATMRYYEYLIPRSVRARVDPAIFSPRSDWKFWKVVTYSREEQEEPDYYYRNKLSKLDEYDYGYGANQTRSYDYY